MLDPKDDAKRRAFARLVEIRAEMRRIYDAFPELRLGRGATGFANTTAARERPGRRWRRRLLPLRESPFGTARR
jgi:hypothetical protein